ncbi:SET domain-containing protein [Aureobasidium sp. EXF-3400]|nr:SET domain-containing protein [Aureobasidium sp. EXF-12344]KAI4769009.1 SET domain-containing protein [Aureobasidium sp. EXF-3400]
MRADKPSRLVARNIVRKSLTEQYLIKWKHTVPSEAVLSWHNVDDLASIADSLQTYIENFKTSLKSGYGNGSLRPPHAGVSSLKRKSPHDEDTPSSRASSLSTSSTSSVTLTGKTEVYNGVLLKKSGDIYPHPLTTGVERIDATTVPTPEMLSAAKAHTVDGIRQGRRFVRSQFKEKLARIPGPPVTLVNDVNKDTPSLAFTYIQDYVLGEGVSRDDADAVKMGCKRCRPDMGGNRGCEYTAKCDCLEFAAPDLTRCKDDDQREQYAAWERGEADSEGLPKRFPYRIDPINKMFVLDPFYLESRHPIYECNELCNCGKNCKNRLVQKGRKVPLEIFRTPQRDFGLRCPVDLKRGQYIDRYLGELITDRETTIREATGTYDKASYLFSLDKHAEDDEQPGALHKSDCYVADGEKMGGPTRFINHSCEPNCRLFTVSYNRFDRRIYDLAFFALENIPAGDELTFDYMDVEETESAPGQANDTMDEGGVKCLCGAKNCRGKLWM